MAYNRRDDDLAYGDDHRQQREGEADRGFIGDVGKRIFGGGVSTSHSVNQNPTFSYTRI